MKGSGYPFLQRYISQVESFATATAGPQDSEDGEGGDRKHAKYHDESHLSLTAQRLGEGKVPIIEIQYHDDHKNK